MLRNHVYREMQFVTKDGSAESSMETKENMKFQMMAMGLMQESG